MKAGLITGLRRLELVEVDEPVAVPGVAVVDVTLCGICGTDVHGYLSDTPYNPAICGHEWAGVVRDVGDGVREVAPGDRVVLAVPPACGRCRNCRAGRSAFCDTVLWSMLGRDDRAPRHGGFAPSIAVAADRLVVVHPELSDVQAAMVEPLTVALHAIRRTPMRTGDVVVVQGCGPIGLLTIQCALAAGAGSVIAVEPRAARRELAERLGASVATTPEAAAGVLPDGGVDVVFECAGVPSTVQAAVDLVRRGGIVSVVGLASGPAQVVPSTWLAKEVTIVASLGYAHEEFALAMALVADGRVELEPVHDATVGLDELAGTFEQLADDPASATKVLVDPRRER